MKKRNIYEMTAQEVWDRIMEVENFRGRRANLEKVRRYKRMEGILREMKRTEKAVLNVGFLPPASDHMNGMVYVDLTSVAGLTKQGQRLLADLTDLGDDIYEADIKGNVRLSFCIYDVWEA